MTDRNDWPEPQFEPRRWLSWKELMESPPRAAKEHRGAYVIARFPESPGDLEPDPADEHVLYIGETHGRATCLLSRLKQFGDSAGFSKDRSGRPKGRCAGHYAAWGFRCDEPAYEDPRKPVPSDDVYVGLCPVPENEEWVKSRPDARGILPGLFESMLLWAHLRKRSVLPALNNSGRQDPDQLSRDDLVGAAVNALDSESIAALLSGPKNSEEAYVAAEQLVAAIAAAWGYKQAKVYRDEWDDVRVCSRVFGPGKWLCVGWSASPPLAHLSLWRGEECLFGPENGENGAPDEDAFRRLVERLLREC